MRAPAALLATFELLRFRTPLARLALVFVTIVPMLYGAGYLAANWDPYGRLPDLPVAVVNDDQPAEVGGRTVTAGADFVTNLHEQDNFDWHDVSDAEARRGLRDGDYYLAVHVPADFSTNLVSGQGEDPQRAQITIRRDDANGFVIGSVTNSAQNSIARSVDESAVASYFEAVFANLATIRRGLVEASTGASDLHDGLVTAEKGSSRLVAGTRTAADGATALSTGATQLSTGLATARTGSADLATGLDTLETSAGRLSTGAAQVAAGNKELNDRVQPALAAAQQSLPGLRADAEAVSDRLGTIATRAQGRTSSVSSDLDTASAQLAALSAQYPELAGSAAFRQAQSSVGSASERAEGIASDVQRGAARVQQIRNQVRSGGDLDARISGARDDLDDLADGSAAVASGAQQLQTGIRQASGGADRLQTGIGSAATGASDLAGGASTLSTGVTALGTGARRLDRGLVQARDGSATLADRLDRGAERIPTLTADEQDEAVQVLSAPAEVTTQIDHPATYYGRGLAPLFLSIALWVFGISVFLVVRPVSGRALVGRAGVLRRALTAWLPVGGLAVLAGWLMAAVVWLGLGLDPVHPVLFLGLVTLGAVCFSAVAHVLRTALGPAGSSLLLVLLILQLTAGGGTYPPPLLPDLFAAIHPYLPMTYLIDAFRVAISGGQLSHLLVDVALLALVAAVALGLGVLTVRRRAQFRLQDLHPPLAAPSSGDLRHGTLGPTDVSAGCQAHFYRVLARVPPRKWRSEMPGNAPPVTDELGGLLVYLRQQRNGLAYAAHGLTEDQLRQRPTAGALSVGGLLKHAAATERSWSDVLVGRDEQTQEAYLDSFAVHDDDTLTSLLAGLDETARATEAAVASVAGPDAEITLPVAPWMPTGGGYTVRWVLLHIFEELSRHAGHADIVRESIDGATMYALMAAVEGWPETDWLKPWRPAG